ncbi:hypothetical protein GCM10007862_16840 [Dyella lipolytica]|nr:hypothetical protein GCM10007862_16840 [Dyella lipolytica]
MDAGQRPGDQQWRLGYWRALDFRRLVFGFANAHTYAYSHSDANTYADSNSDTFR